MALDDSDKRNPWLPRTLWVAWRLAGEAIRAGDDGALRRVLADQPALTTNGYINSTLLQDAVQLGRAGAVAALLDAGVPADEYNGFGVTPLMTAAWDGHAEVVRLLLEAGADPNAVIVTDRGYDDPNAYGRCALWGAVYGGHRAVIDLLEPVTSPGMRAQALEAAARQHDDDFEDALPYPEETLALLRAARWGEQGDLSFAIEDGGDVSVRLRPEESHRWLGSTPLSFAAGRGRMDLVGALLEAGADLGQADHDGRTAADFADLNGHPEIAEFLRSRRRESGSPDL